MSSGGEEAAPFHGPYTKDILYELHRRQPHRFHFMSKFNAKSASWKDFELVVLDGELRDFARCVHCKNFVSYSSKKGTGSMLRHRCHAKESYFTGEPRARRSWGPRCAAAGKPTHRPSTSRASALFSLPPADRARPIVTTVRPVACSVAWRKCLSAGAALSLPKHALITKCYSCQHDAFRVHARTCVK